MSGHQSITISLPDDLADLLRAKVASGEYVSESDVIGDGLRSLVERDVELEHWLEHEVLPTMDAIDVDPSRVVAAAEAWDRLESHMSKGSARTGSR